MKIGVRLYYFKNGEMKLFSNTEKVCDWIKADKKIRNWYRDNPYAKRVDEEWICCDYRVDQQRPQRNVYSEAYIKISSMTEMENKHITNLINNLEKNIEYPTVWDDGKNRYYEETIYCPNCGKRRKVLTSKTHCEKCGFKFEDALKCQNCGALNLKGSKYCINCNHKFRKKSFINNDDFEVKKDEYIEKIKCPNCNSLKSRYFDVCQNCGFDYSNKKRCFDCGNWIDMDSRYCGYCGRRVKLEIECCECGKLNDEHNNYCNYCGSELK